jgi:hypothetical protein
MTIEQLREAMLLIPKSYPIERVLLLDLGQMELIRVTAMWT